MSCCVRVAAVVSLTIKLSTCDLLQLGGNSAFRSGFLTFCWFQSCCCCCSSFFPSFVDADADVDVSPAGLLHCRLPATQVRRRRRQQCGKAEKSSYANRLAAKIQLTAANRAGGHSQVRLHQTALQQAAKLRRRGCRPRASAAPRPPNSQPK